MTLTATDRHGLRLVPRAKTGTHDREDTIGENRCLNLILVGTTQAEAIAQDRATFDVRIKPCPVLTRHRSEA